MRVTMNGETYGEDGRAHSQDLTGVWIRGRLHRQLALRRLLSNGRPVPPTAATIAATAIEYIDIYQ
jgi:hypothetical protein